MSNRFFMGNMAGVGRVRTAKLGYDVTDPSLDPRYLTFDSTWLNSLRLIASGEIIGSSLADDAISYPSYGGFGAGGYRNIKVIDTSIVPALAGSSPDRPTIAFVKSYGGSVSFIPAGAPSSATATTLPYSLGYGVAGVSRRNNNLAISPRRNDLGYVYYIFGTDPTASEGGGANSSLFGNHPTYGPGLFVARPGHNALTAGLDDMMLSTRKNHFQFAETGVAMLQYVAGAGIYNTDVLYNDTFYTSLGTTRPCRVINLAGYYPNYPPVYMFWNNAARQEHLGSCFWLSPSQIVISGFKDTSTVCRFGVIATDPTYVPGVDSTTGIKRCYASPATGFGVTKHNVDALSATDSDWIFRSDHITPYFNGYEPFYAGRASGFYPLPTSAPAGIPFAFMQVFDPLSGWWCGVGGASTFHLYLPSTFNAYGPIFQAYMVDNTTYAWNWDPAWTSSVTTAYLATTNVSDF